MTSGEKDVLVDCECRESLLDLWLSLAVAEEFMKRLKAQLEQLGEKPEVLRDYSVYRFVVPPFPAFISIPWELGINKREIWVDLAQFVGNREETADSLAAKLASTPCKRQDLQYYNLEDVALLSTVKPFSLMLNPRLPGKEVNQMDDMILISVSLADCYYTVDCYKALLREKPLSVPIPERRKEGLFAIDEACASLAISMKETAKSITNSLWKPAISALERFATPSNLPNQPSFPSQSLGNFTSTYPSGQLQAYNSSIRSDVKCLENLLTQLQPEASVLPQSELFYLLVEKGEDGRQEIHIVNSTDIGYKRVELWLLDSQGERLYEVEIADIQPFRNGVVLSPSKIEDMQKQGGAFLQLPNGNEISLTF